MKPHHPQNFPNGSTRRDFLKKSAAVVVGTHTLNPSMYAETGQPSVAIVTDASDPTLSQPAVP